MTSTWEEILANAKPDTDNEFAAKVSSMTRLTDDEIKTILPTVQDREDFTRLMSIVADATKSNQAKANAINNIDGALNIALPLLEKLI